MNCIICSSTDGIFLFSKALDGQSNQKVTICKCLACKTVYLQDWPSEFVPELYDYYSKRIHQQKSTIYDPITDSRYKTLLNSLKLLVTSYRMLDVGCGEGQFVDVALRCGWDAFGIELSDSAVAICQKFGLPVKKIDIFDPILQPNSFDLITLSEVIEHVASPAQFIARTADLLKPEGLLYLTTPNFNSLDRRILGSDWRAIHPEHLSYFTPSTLKYLIKTYTNLKFIYLETKNISAESILQAAPKIFQPKQLKYKSSLTTNKSPISVDKSQLLRRHIDSSKKLKLLKVSLNKMLNFFGWGSAMVALCQKNT